MDVMFDEPVLARVRGDDGGPNSSRSNRLARASRPCTDVGSAAITGDPAWQATADKLIQAALYPSEVRAAEARDALLKIADEGSDAKLDG
jgi:hypothetical protein